MFNYRITENGFLIQVQQEYPRRERAAYQYMMSLLLLRMPKGTITIQKRKTKTELSISLDDNIIKILNEEFENRSKFIEYCIIKELEKNPEFKERIEKLIIF